MVLSGWRMRMTDIDPSGTVEHHDIHGRYKRSVYSDEDDGS